jgi:hypothetical protein
MARNVLSLSFGLALIASLSFVNAGCDRLDDFLDGIHGGGGGGTIGDACGKARCAAGDVCCHAS